VTWRKRQGRAFRLKSQLVLIQSASPAINRRGIFSPLFIRHPRCVYALPVKMIMGICCPLSCDWTALGKAIFPSAFAEREGKVGEQKLYSQHDGEVFVLAYVLMWERIKIFEKATEWDILIHILPSSKKKPWIGSIPVACEQTMSKSHCPGVKWSQLCYRWLSYWANSGGGIHFSIFFSSSQSQEIWAIKASLIPMFRQSISRGNY